MAVVMSTSNAGSGGVRNLRAIFENKASDLSTSPPSRGRSPTGSATSSHSRPLSKVRTSFVAVERVGEGGGPLQLGLRRISDAVMSSTSGDLASYDGNQREFELGAILKGSPFEDAGKPTKSLPVQASDDRNGARTNGSTDKVSTATKRIAEANSKSVSKPASIQTKTNSPTLSKKSPVIQTVPKPRGGPAKILAVMESAKEAREARAAAASTTSAGTERVKRNDGPRASVPMASKPPRASLPARTGRPLGSATAPTASSVAKTEGSSPTESKATDRKVAIKGPPKVANANTASSLAKKASRASLGVSESAKPRVSTQRPAADEGFLARMMRPTASSAQKAHDKVQVDSPPRSKPSAAAPKTTGNRTSRTSLASVGKNGAAGEEKNNEVTENTAVTPTSAVPSEPTETSVKEDTDVTPNGNDDGNAVKVNGS